MSGFGILMLIFATCVLLTGFYMFTGHKIGLLEYRAAFRNLTISEWKNIGKWTMISSIIIYILAILGIIFNFQ